MKRKLRTAAFAICCLLTVSAHSQPVASYVLAGGVLTNEQGSYNTVAGLGFALETGIRFGKNSVGLQYLSRINDEQMHDLSASKGISLVYGRELLPAKRISLSLHGGLGVEEDSELFTVNDDRRRSSLLAPLYADLRFNVSSTNPAKNSFWLGIRGGRYFSTSRSFTVVQLHASMIIPW